ncbi:hypothetical protein MMC18_001297 [Xylographa bjoerkii]|nr:hypothetical protein [Xylographa bjoerkii]
MSPSSLITLPLEIQYMILRYVLVNDPPKKILHHLPPVSHDAEAKMGARMLLVHPTLVLPVMTVLLRETQIDISSYVHFEKLFTRLNPTSCLPKTTLIKRLSLEMSWCAAEVFDWTRYFEKKSFAIDFPAVTHLSICFAASAFLSFFSLRADDNPIIFQPFNRLTTSLGHIKVANPKITGLCRNRWGDRNAALEKTMKFEVAVPGGEAEVEVGA